MSTHTIPNLKAIIQFQQEQLEQLAATQHQLRVQQFQAQTDLNITITSFLKAHQGPVLLGNTRPSKWNVTSSADILDRLTLLQTSLATALNTSIGSGTHLFWRFVPTQDFYSSFNEVPPISQGGIPESSLFAFFPLYQIDPDELEYSPEPLFHSNYPLFQIYEHILVSLPIHPSKLPPEITNSPSLWD